MEGCALCNEMRTNFEAQQEGDKGHLRCTCNVKDCLSLSSNSLFRCFVSSPWTPYLCSSLAVGLLQRRDVNMIRLTRLQVRDCVACTCPCVRVLVTTTREGFEIGLWRDNSNKANNSGLTGDIKSTSNMRQGTDLSADTQSSA